MIDNSLSLPAAALPLRPRQVRKPSFLLRSNEQHSRKKADHQNTHKNEQQAVDIALQTCHEHRYYAYDGQHYQDRTNNGFQYPITEFHIEGPPLFVKGAGAS